MEAAGTGAERADVAAAKAREDEVASISEKRPIHLRAVTAGIAPPSPSPLVAPPYVPLIVPQLRSRSSIVHGINTQIDNANLRSIPPLFDFCGRVLITFIVCVFG